MAAFSRSPEAPAKVIGLALPPGPCYDAGTFDGAPCGLHVANLIRFGVEMVRRLLVPFVSVLVAVLLTSCNACMDQFDPRPDHAKFEKEREIATANANAPKLSKTGDLPQAGAVAFDINERYTTFCSNCHGATGQGDGPGSAALNPKPRNLTDTAWQASVDDARIYKVIKEGGGSVGLSATMAPWGAVLSDAEIQAMVAKVRSFKP